MKGGFTHGTNITLQARSNTVPLAKAQIESQKYPPENF